MMLQELITHIIIEDTNRKECATTRAKALFAKANMVENKLTSKRYKNKHDNKMKNNFRNSRSNGSNSTFKRRVTASYVGSQAIMHLNAGVE